MLDAQIQYHWIGLACYGQRPIHIDGFDPQKLCVELDTKCFLKGLTDDDAPSKIRGG
jgi:hypothetical protein